MSGTRATLGGIPLLGHMSVGWSITRGTRPYQRIFEVRREDAEALLLQNRGVDLIIECPGYAPLKVFDLYVMSSQNSLSHPDRVGILVADKRVWWNRQHVTVDANIRRRTGDVRLTVSGNIERRQVADDVDYTAPSLKDSKPWKAAELINEVIYQADGRFPDLSRVKRDGAAIETVFIDDPGDIAVQKALDYMGGVDVFISRLGQTVLIDARDGAEGDLILAAGAAAVGMGVVEASDKRAWRPASIRVLFERELEIRFDYTENPAQSVGFGLVSGGEISDNGRPPRKLYNVIQVPDAVLGSSGGLLVGGQWTPIQHYINALATVSRPLRAAPITHAIMRRYYLGQWSYVDHLYCTDDRGNPEATWIARIAALRRHWRLSYRIDKGWMDRFKSISPFMVSKIDDEQGMRTQSPVYCDWTKRPSLAKIYRSRSESLLMGFWVRGYADDLADGHIAPASVRIIDPETGILRVTLHTDPWGDSEGIAPGYPDASPTQAPGNLYGFWSLLGLADDFRLAVILTCVPAMPQDVTRYHDEVVSPEEASGALGQGIGPCTGPPMYIKVGGGLITARFAWSDSEATAIEECVFKGTAPPWHLMMNYDEVRAVALAEAARQYAFMMDRNEGTQTYPLNPDLEPVGAIGRVEHELLPSGTALSRMTMMPHPQDLPIWNFMPTSTQRILRRLVQLQ